MLLCSCAYGVKSEISLDTGDSAPNAVVKRFVFINQRCAECVCLYYGLRVCRKKYSIIICDRLRKVVSQLNKHDDVIERNFMKTAPPRNEDLVAPLTYAYITKQTRNSNFLRTSSLVVLRLDLRSITILAQHPCRGGSRYTASLGLITCSACSPYNKELSKANWFTRPHHTDWLNATLEACVTESPFAPILAGTIVAMWR